MELVPIAIPVYDRIHHLQQCIEALKCNSLALGTDLYIYSDAAATKEAEVQIQELRSYLATITGFKKVYVIEQRENLGATENSLFAWQDVMKKTKDGLSIYMEDDIVTAPGFLEFMNQALNFYKGNDNILSISGYTPPFKLPCDYSSDVFVLPRVSSWGIGLFTRTADAIMKTIDKREFNLLPDKKVLTVAGNDVLRMVELEVKGKLNAGDVRCMYYQAVHNKYTVYPRESLVQNIGHDGSGMHCGVSEKFYHEKLWNKDSGFQFNRDIELDPRIQKANFDFRKLGYKSKMVRYAKIIGLYSLLVRLKALL